MISGRLVRQCGGEVFEPPVPAVMDRIIISDLAGTRHPSQWCGVIDTGADRTVVPIRACQELGLELRDKHWVLGFDQSAPRQRVPRYYVCLCIETLGEFTLLAYAAQRSSIVLGRDFLEKLVLVVDSPSEQLRLGRKGMWSKLLLGILSLR